MLKDEIVALLPDLRAFARFMCRDREAADDLVQSTVVIALDKQSQFSVAPSACADTPICAASAGVHRRSTGRTPPPPWPSTIPKRRSP